MEVKSTTDLEQSKKLAAGILPPESADMYWWSSGKRYYIESMDDDDFNEKEGHIRAWSIVALLMEMPNIIAGCIKTLRLFDNAWHCCFIDTKTSKCLFDTSAYEPVDACVEMILKLHERKLL